MIIGTTPTFTLKIKRTSNVDLTLANNIYITLKQGSILLTKTGVDVIIVDEKTIQVSLTQEESLNFTIDKPIELQLNWTYNEANIVKRAATKVATVSLEKQLLKQVLT